MRRNTEDREADRFERYAQRFQYACMSNTKWRKVLSAIAESGLELRRTEYKTVECDMVTVVNREPLKSDIELTRFSDGQFQPTEYKWLQWLRFPRSFRPYEGETYTVHQDVESLYNVITQAAAAEVELDDDYLWLYGYKNPIW